MAVFVVDCTVIRRAPEIRAHPGGRCVAVLDRCGAWLGRLACRRTPAVRPARGNGAGCVDRLRLPLWFAPTGKLQQPAGYVVRPSLACPAWRPCETHASDHGPAALVW